MMPHPMVMFLVWVAMTAVIAVEERASIPCLCHQGYASASQKMSNPARSQACAMRTVWCSGSMLNCKTPMRKGTAIDVIHLLLLEIAVRYSPALLGSEI